MQGSRSALALKTNISLVKGYIDDSDQDSVKTILSSPHRRIAVITLSEPGPEDGTFNDVIKDAKLLTGLMKHFCEGADFRLLSEKESTWVSSTQYFEWSRIEELILSWNFRMLIGFRNDIPWIQFVEVPYFKTGGPAPYHDSVTLEILVLDSQFERVWDSLNSYFSQLEKPLTIIEGKIRPSNNGFWRSFFRKMSSVLIIK